MSRAAPIPKTINGQPVTQDAFKNAIVEAIAKRPEQRANAADIAFYLGNEWLSGPLRQNLSQTLVNMASTGLLRRVEGERGVYEARVNAKRGVSKVDMSEKSILACLRRHGGFARWRDIMEDQGLLPTKEARREARAWYLRKANDDLSVGELRDAAMGMKAMHVDDVRDSYAYRFITRLLGTSEHIRQDLLVPGLYNLPMAEIHAMPLRGRWASQMFKWTRHNLYPEEQRQRSLNWMLERDAFFSRVGDAFRELRESQNVEPEDLVKDRTIYAALLEMGKSKLVQARIDEEWSLETQAEIERMMARAAPAEDIGAYRSARVDNKRAKDLVLTVLEYFESGVDPENGIYVGVNTHLAAPLSLYTAFAEKFGVCPILLSRGVIFYQPAAEKFRPTDMWRPTPDVTRLNELTEYRESQRQLRRNASQDL